MNSMLILEIIWKGEVVRREMVPKVGKNNIYGQKFQGGTGTTQQKPIGTGTDTSGTGTAQQNQIDTGTEQSGIGTVVPKMPRLL